MKELLTTDDIVAVLRKMAADFEAQQGYLNELDSAIGDGDHGISMTLGFRAVVDALPGLTGQDIGTMLMKCGVAFNSKAASTIGILMATAFMRAGKAVQGKTELSLADLATMGQAAEQGIRERGKAAVGDKTLLDALAPAAATLSTAAAGNSSLLQAMEEAQAAAEAGMKSTIDMKSKIGRAAWLQDRTIGKQDPGATSIYLMFKSVVEYLRESG